MHQAEIRVNVAAGIGDDAVHFVQPGIRVDEWMYDNYPHGFGRPAICSINGEYVERVKLSHVMQAGDQIRFVAPPAGFAAGFLMQALISALVSTALSLIAGALLKKPKPPASHANTTPAADPVYSVVRPNNQMRVSEPVQVIYGDVVSTPDIASQPYVFYRNNDQYYHAILCVGAGDVEVDDVLLGDTPVKSMLSGAVNWWLYKPADHGSVMGRIETAHGIMENVVTAVEVGGIEIAGGSAATPTDVVHKVPLTFTAPNKISGYNGDIAAGTSIIISGTTGNNGTFTVASAAGGLITVTQNTIVNEAMPPRPAGTLTYNSWRRANNDDATQQSLVFFNPATDWVNAIESGSLLTFSLDDNEGNTVATFTNVKVSMVSASSSYDSDACIVTFEIPVTVTARSGSGVSTIAFTEGKIPVTSTLTIKLSNSVNTTSFYASSKPGDLVDKLMLDITFPGGMYYINHTGGYVAVTVEYDIEYQQINEDGTPLSPIVTLSKSISKMTTTPIRLTETIDVRPGRYGVRINRITPALTTSGTSNMTWESLKARIVDVTRPIYGNVTLLAIEIKSTNGVSHGASSAIRVRCHRNYKRPGTRALTVRKHASPDDVVYDIMTNTSYGAGRPATEFDAAEFSRVRANWGSYGRFDGVFSQRSTVWEAMTLALQTVAAAPLPIGNKISLIQDGKKISRTYLFNDQNIVRGTMNVKYSFLKEGEPDGVMVEYRDPDTFTPEFVKYPANAVNYDSVKLFGCVDRDIAEGHAILILQKKHRLRKFVEFETEMDAIIPRIGDRIGVTSRLPKWGQSGSVVSVAGLNVITDANLDWSEAGQHVVSFILDDGTPSAPVNVTRGANDHEFSLAAPVAIHGEGQKEATKFVFGTAVSMTKDFSVTEVSHSGGGKFKLSAVVYDERAYSNTLPFLQVAI